MNLLAGLSTAICLAAFLAICCWAWSSGRKNANRESALLPFALPDEAQEARPRHPTLQD
ncbi:CcoQ/FixQ family Cbb3-type cytochrome c oxidase assembly chaperone [Cupriavidus sp. AU9028]|uniref:cbb3-type cytochrome oxidase subunit 3 n=1 Tax=Cupriavidus sp. AU9028 TaxID=2871157 RepID=UPI001C97CCCF|nr:CcoQ/FixQ family Cbb3-type cytochrome c oxidase assembly chaperone [Cupriavidus sp. AU9028]MBY4898089.1 CcoQ/FixQ family Cbb3-type cytochrome c oxidase assembly chaperone [Cupriavidus sp. AU9028]